MAQGDSRIAICAMMGHEPCDTIGHAPRPPSPPKLPACPFKPMRMVKLKRLNYDTTSANYRLLRATTQKL